MDTCNSTAWTGAQRFLLKTRAHVVLLQEHHLGPERLADASAWALRHGWHSLFLPAEPGSGTGWRAGVAILARPVAGLSVPRFGPAEVVPARVLAASIHPPGFRRCMIMSTYLEDGKGLSAVNLRHLEQIGSSVAAQGDNIPCIIGGDWQVPPAELATTGFATQAGMAIVASGHERGTYREVRRSTELDYFAVTNGLTLGLDNVHTVEGAAVRPLVPVRLEFKPRMASTRALHLRCPPPLPTSRLIGPLRQPPCWEQLGAKAKALAARAADPADACDGEFAAQFDQLYSEWADRAEVELVEATGAHFSTNPRSSA